MRHWALGMVSGKIASKAPVPKRWAADDDELAGKCCKFREGALTRLPGRSGA